MMSSLRVFSVLTLAALAAGLGTAQDSRLDPHYVSPGFLHRVRVTPRDKNDQVLTASRAVVSRQDYGAFSLLIVDERAFGGRDALLGLEAEMRDFEAVVTFLDAPVDTALPNATEASRAAIPAEFRAGAVETVDQLAVIQFAGPVRREWLAALRATGARIVDYVPYNAYIVYVDEAARDRFAAFGADPAVQWSAPLDPWFKLSTHLRSPELRAHDTLDVWVQVLAGADGDIVADYLAAMGAIVLGEDMRVLSYRDMHVRIPAGILPILAAAPAVTAVQLAPVGKLHDEGQGLIMATQPLAPGSDYLAWLTGTAGFSSSAQLDFIVDVADDGIDQGSLTTINSEFRRDGLPSSPSRVLYYNQWSTSAGGSSIAGHGNINASILGGFQVNPPLAPLFADSNGFRRGMGIIPWAKMGASKIFSNTGTLTTTSPTTFVPAAFASGARITSNSWGEMIGSAPYTTYGVSAQAYDTLVRDGSGAAGSPGTDGLVVVFAAGNSGSGATTVTSPGCAKNVLTVGASEVLRSSGTDGCGITNTLADNPNDMATFSGRGPTPDGRHKPDIVAPGTHITGAASQAAGYTGVGVCNPYLPSGQTLYALSSGTSHSTPAVAGAAALLRQDLQTAHLPPPSPALTKAALMATGRYLNGTGAGGDLWSEDQGMGCVNLNRLFTVPQHAIFDQLTVLNTTGATWSTTLNIANPALQTRIGLAWTDAPGGLAGGAWKNDLDLTVSVGSTVYRGNHFSVNQSTTGGTADSKNNAEFVTLPAGTGGTIVITVTAANLVADGVPGNAGATDQDFALFVDNVFGCCAPTITAVSPDVQSCAANSTTLSVTATASCGVPLYYRWSKDGAEIPGAYASTYVIPSVDAAALGGYSCRVTTPCLTSTTSAIIHVSAATLAVTAQPPASTAVCPGATSISGSFVCTGTAPITYQWRKGGVPIAGATSSTLTLPRVEASQGAYDCVATGPCQSATSQTWNLNIYDPVTLAPITGPTSPVCVGSTATFTVTAAGTGPFTYQWRHDGVPISGATAASYTDLNVTSADGGGYDVIVTGLCTSAQSNAMTLVVNVIPSVSVTASTTTPCQGSTVTFTASSVGLGVSYTWLKDGQPVGGPNAAVYSPTVTAASNGAYACRVTNTCGTTTSTAVTITSRMSPTGMISATVLNPCIGGSTTLTAVAAGGGPYTYSWQRNSVAVPGAPNSPTFTISPVTAATTGNYDCRISTTCGFSFTNALAITALAAPTVTVNASATLLCAGSPLTLTATATGGGPYTYQWKLGGTAIVGAPNAATYTIPAIGGGQGGSYTCTVQNGCNIATSPAVGVTVNTPPFPTISAPNQLCSGSSVTISVASLGTPPFSYSWQRDGILMGGATSSSITFSPATVADSASYTCLVTNSCGTVSTAPFPLVVRPPTVIASITPSQSVCEGAPFTFGVTATGAGALVYQWRLGGTAISGATAATYSVGAALPSHAGSYDCVVVGACGTATSSAVTLAVTAPPITAIAPAMIAPLTPASPPVVITLSGTCFLAGSVVYANHVPLTTTFVSATTLQALLPAAVEQTQFPGGIGLAVKSPAGLASNLAMLDVGGPWTNAGGVRMDPLDIVPGTFTRFVVEGGTPISPVTLIADLGGGASTAPWPDPAGNYVLAVTPYGSATGPFIAVFDGFGLFGAADGAQLDVNGRFQSASFQLPPVVIGYQVTFQAVYLDPAAPLGINLTYAVYPVTF